MRLFTGRGAKVGRGSSYLWYSIWFLGQDIYWHMVLSLASVAIFIYFILLSFVFLYLTYFYIFMYIIN